jgi:hypothetical protein
VKVERFEDVRVTHRVDERLRAVSGPHTDELACVPNGFVQDQRNADGVGRRATSGVEEESTRLNGALRERDMALQDMLSHSWTHRFEKKNTQYQNVHDDRGRRGSFHPSN